MKKHFYAIMDSEGRFLTEFKTNGSNVLAFGATWSRDVEDALINPLEEQLEDLKLWAKLVDGQVVFMGKEYIIRTLDNERIDVEAMQESIKPTPSKMFEEIFEDIFGRGEN